MRGDKDIAGRKKRGNELMLKAFSNSRALSLTLKAFVDFSPGFRFWQPGFQKASKRFLATLKELRSFRD